MQTALNAQAYSNKQALYIAFELSDKTWKLVFSNGTKKRHKTVEACNQRQVLEEIDKAKAHFKLPATVGVISCYEAGWEGFWLARWLRSEGVCNYVVDSSAIEVNRKARRAKTDRLDGDKLLLQLMRYYHGEQEALSIVRVPTLEAEDNRRLHREREVLVRERGRHWVRIKSLLRQQGIRLGRKKMGFAEQLSQMRCWDGQALPPELKREIEHQWERHNQVDAQIRRLEALQKERIKTAVQEGDLRQIQQLMLLKAVGWQSAWILVMEFFGWRAFRNRRELAALAGLTPTPYQSGDSEREQGISKAGNHRVRSVLVELSWLWLRYQPHSSLSQWYQKRFASGGKRLRRIGIVAMARKLLIALWRYVEHGEIPEGAVFT